MPGKRRRARIAALKTLFEVDSVGHPPDEILDRQLEDSPLPEDAAQFARELVRGVLEQRERLDEIIRKNAPAWPLEQVAAVDRSILRLAIYEIVIDNRVPMRAAINEAVELAKEFGGEASPKFVNGVLGSVAATGTRR
ncbi:MAG: transcription antitermination factor NusB [Dehalococcoidia bacterium]|nr:transcription antitermination factor NusB [Dehalococcoidia bacterium]